MVIKLLKLNTKYQNLIRQNKCIKFVKLTTVFIMRKFLIFKINPEMSLLCRDHPYNLYRPLEQIFKMAPNDLVLGSSIYEQIITLINQTDLNRIIYDYFKDNDYYSTVNNKHFFYNKYRPENSILEVKNSYLILQSDAAIPAFFSCLKHQKNFLVCDFYNRDYFWVDKLIYSR